MIKVVVDLSLQKDWQMLVDQLQTIHFNILPYTLIEKMG